MISLIVLLGVILRFSTLGLRPFDGDEGAMIIISQNWHRFFEQLSLDIHPPLYPFLLGIFTNLLSTSEFSARLLSALSGTIFILLIYLLGKKIFSEKVGIIAAALSAISPYLLYFDQEARMYSPFLILSTGSLLGFISILEKSNFKRWAVFALLNLLLILTHHLGFILILFYAVYLIILRRDLLKHFLISLSATLVLYSFYLTTLLDQVKGRLSEQPPSFDFISSVSGVLGTYFRFTSGRLFLDLKSYNLESIVSRPFNFLLLALSVFLPTFIFIKGLLKVKTPLKKSLAVFFFVVSILSVFNLELGSKASRYLIFLFPIYLLILSLGISDIWQNLKFGRWRAGETLVLFLAVLSLAGIFDHLWRENRAAAVNNIAEKIWKEKKDGDMVLMRGSFSGGEKFVFNYYFEKQNQDKIKKEIAVVDLLGDYYRPGNLEEIRKVKPSTKITELLRTKKRVWFYDFTYQENPLSGLPSDLPAQAGYKVEKINLGKDKEKMDLILWKIEK